MPITSPHNDKLKTVRKLRQRRRDRERLGQFVAEGEDLLAAADAAGWEPVERFCVTGSGLPGTEVEPELLAVVTELASGTRTLAIYKERWQAGATGPPVRLPARRPRPGQRRHGAALRRRVRRRLRRFRRRQRRPVQPKAVRASMGAIFEVPVAHAGLGSCRA